MLLHMFFPSKCVACGSFGKVLCAKCKNSIKPVTQDSCIICYRNSINGQTHETCKKTSYIDNALAIIKYTGAGRDWIGAIKYKRAYSTISEVVSFFPQSWVQKFKKITQYYTDALIVPIPLHKQREKMRGFNQSEKIAKEFSKIINIPISCVLLRVINTPQQAKQPTKNTRKENIKGAFILKQGEVVKNKTIILIDDLYTSGHTAQEAAKILKIAGAKTVLLFTLAHGKV